MFDDALVTASARYEEHTDNATDEESGAVWFGHRSECEGFDRELRVFVGVARVFVEDR